jgi:hypothetical protein
MFDSLVTKMRKTSLLPNITDGAIMDLLHLTQGSQTYAAYTRHFNHFLWRFREQFLQWKSWDSAERMACHFESCRRITSTFTMALFVLHKWAKFNDITRHYKKYQEFHARTLSFSRQSVNDLTQH